MKELLPWVFWLLGVYCIARAIDLWKQSEHRAGFTAGYNMRVAEETVREPQVYRQPEREV